MFDIGFLEILIIAVVALVVIGPERMPSAIRTVAIWFGRIKRAVQDTRDEVEKQLGAEEIRQELHNLRVLNDLEQKKRLLENKILNEDLTSPEASINPPTEGPTESAMEAATETKAEDEKEPVKKRTAADYTDEPEELPDSYPHNDQGIALADASNSTQAPEK